MTALVSGLRTCHTHTTVRHTTALLLTYFGVDDEGAFARVWSVSKLFRIATISNKDDDDDEEEGEEKER